MPFSEESRKKAQDTRDKKAQAALKRAASARGRLQAEAKSRAVKNDVLYKESATAAELYAAIKESSRLLRALAK